MIWTSSVFFAPIISMVVRVFATVSQSQKFSIPIRGHSRGVPCLLFTTVHHSVWTCYGIFVTDHFILASYALGVVSGGLEFCTLFFSKRAVPPQEEIEDFHKLTKISKSSRFSHSD